MEPYRAMFGGRLLIDDRAGLRVSDMEAAIVQAQRGPFAGADQTVLIVDHLGIVGGDREHSTYDRVSTQARELKDAAKRTGAAVIVAIQVNRASGAAGSEPLGLGAARDSGVVEEVCSTLITLRRPERAAMLSPAERDRLRNIIAARLVKNRHGDLGDEVPLKLDPISLQLWETVGQVLPVSQRRAS
jgi:replicative DNA helicase